jgi:tetratricopeptide (TPR) repeat protein
MKHKGALHSSNIDRLTDIAEIEDGIKYCQQVVASYPDSELASNARLALVDLFERAFRRTNEIEYINQAISITHDNMSTTHSHLFQHISFSLYFSRLCTRFFLLRREEDMDELIRQFSKLDSAENKFLIPNVEFVQQLAFVARFKGHPSASIAYESAMSSFQASLTYAPTIDIQHSRLVTMGDLVKTIPLDYASYQIHHGQLERAIETLERGRSLLWSEMRGLRTSIDRIRSADSRLANRFATVNQDLEALTLSLSPNNIFDGRDGAFDGKDPYGDLVARQRKLLDEREQLISRIQALPGFDNFLKRLPSTTSARLHLTAQ